MIIVYQLLAHGRWFSPGTLTSSTTKTGHHDIAEILLKVALKTKNQSINQSYMIWPGWLNDLGSWITKQPIQAYHQYGVGSRPAL